MSTEPAGEGFPLIVPRAMTAASDMHCLPAQWKIQCKRRARARIAFHSNLSRVFLNDAVCHRKSQSSSAVLAFLRCGLGREKWIVNPLNVLRRNARARV